MEVCDVIGHAGIPPLSDSVLCTIEQSGACRLVIVKRMFSWNQAERLEQEAAELGSYSTRIAVVLSLVCSLAAVVILSRNHLTNLWINAAVFAVPIPIALYFKNRIGRFGVFSHMVALFLALGAAVAFGL